MPRHARLDAPGTLHHVILRGIEKRQIVDDKKDRQDFVNRMGKIASDTGTHIYAWALLTNHAHVLLRSSSFGVSRYMRSLLTGYAIRYNRRHGRHGHLFQNRYKSIICEEETYFLELVRYIHLNPLRAGLVKNMTELAQYEWSGHGVLMGRLKNDWQMCDPVLERFGKKVQPARAAYQEFVSEVIAQGRRPELVGGGLVRSLGGWSEVKALRKLGIEEASDDRILGSGEFVEQILNEAAGNLRRQYKRTASPDEIEKIVVQTCKHKEVNPKELRSGSRRRSITEVRRQIIRQLVEEHGVSLAEIARQVGISTSAVSKSLNRTASAKVH